MVCDFYVVYFINIINILMINSFYLKLFLGIDSAFSGTIGGHALNLCFYQKASDQLQLGCELETNFRMGESTATVGYQIDLPKADLVFKGMNVNWIMR